MNHIFISYSHKDEAWKDRVLTYLKVLEHQGYSTAWNDREIVPGADWYAEIKDALETAQIFILLLSVDFLASEFINKKEVPAILKQWREQGGWVIPLVIRPCPWQSVPWVQALQLYPQDGIPLSSMPLYKSEESLSKLINRIAGRVQLSGEAGQRGGITPLPPERVFISKLPTTGENVYGREKELEMLSQAWSDTHIHVFSLVAWGGVGKSALVNEWLNIMEEQHYGGAHRVYAWSFYSQGAAEGKQASADEFLQHALAWFGDADPGAGSNVDKGRRLAEWVRKEKTLLILDGLEPLQYPPGELREFDGQLKDHGLRTLLKELAGTQPGLCVITSREPIADLRDKKDHTYRELELEHLSVEAGVHLVKSLGVTGRAPELAEAVKEYGGHALALTLLGNYLCKVYRGDIRQRDKIPALTMDKKKGRHARRVMEAYERWLGESPELNILRIMGLFDRPVEKEAIDALTAPGTEPIPGITERLAGLTNAEWGYALANLRGVGMLAKEDPQKPDVLDCHPLVREHFGEKLRSENPEGWQAAHRRLYEYYKALPEKEFPDTLGEMESLFAAVAHGCAAGIHQQVWDDVFDPKINRTNEMYTVKKLGAFGFHLSALSHFFREPWGSPEYGLREDVKTVVLSWAGFDLRALGRLVEALQPFMAGMEASIKLEDWIEAAQDAGNLSELCLILGSVSEAVDYARKAVEYADKSGDGFQRETKRCALANSLHQQGNIEEAETWFRDAEALRKERRPEYPYLYSLVGFHYCDLLLGQGKYEEVLERAEHGIKIAKRNNWLLDIAHDQLSLGRSYLLQTLVEKPGDFISAETYLHQAVEDLRKSGRDDFLPLGFFARAELFRYQGKFKEAWADLNEAEEIARLGGMRLHLADYHLEAARLSDAEGKTEAAQTHREAAKKLIEEMGYGRRKF